MPIVLLITLLIIGILLTDILAYGPLGLLGLLHIPQWLAVGVLGTAIAWIMGDD